MTWEFPAVEPPNYLQQLNPALYVQQCQRVHSRFDGDIQLAEQAFLEELSKFVERLSERLTGAEDGKTKVSRDSAAENLTQFFERFRRLNIGSNEQLDALVGDTKRILRGVEPQELRDRSSYRGRVASQLATGQAPQRSDGRQAAEVNMTRLSTSVGSARSGLSGRTTLSRMSLTSGMPRSSMVRSSGRLNGVRRPSTRKCCGSRSIACCIGGDRSL